MKALRMLLSALVITGSVCNADTTLTQGILRTINGNWGVVEDSFHHSKNIDAVYPESWSLKVVYKECVDSLGSANTAVDETFMSLGLRTGVSVGSCYSRIFFKKDLNIKVDINSFSPYISYHPYFKGTVRLESLGNNIYKLYHPSTSTVYNYPIYSGEVSVIKSDNVSVTFKSKWDNDITFLIKDVNVNPENIKNTPNGNIWFALF